ncbi:tetratricopeptide repeat protein [Archangium sp.]|uniref:tetratricopeptide repeat protein n=1 Tax=Archangium sp. TaxID=1872627 RepID=UPI00389A2548
MPALPSPYVPAAPSAAALEALRLFQAGCLSETYDDALCGQAVRQLEAVVRDDPRQLDARLALAEAVWNQAFRQPDGSAERARLRQRSLALYQQLVDQGVQDPRPYYGLSGLTRDPDTRLRLLRRAVALEPKHPDAHKDLAWSLLERGQVDEAMREYRLHLSLHPARERADAFEDLRFAKKLGELGHVREAAEVYDAVWDATRDESRAQRCQIFKTVDLDPYERIGARFAQRVREIRAACADTPRLEHAQELERQGQDDAAVQELERQIQENPVPVEPYLELERLHQKQGRMAEAAAVMTRYFQQEKNPAERCRHFRTLSPGTARAMDPGLINELDRACRTRQP